MGSPRIEMFDGEDAQTRAYGRAQAEMSLALVDRRAAGVRAEPHGDGWRVVVDDDLEAADEGAARGFHVFDDEVKVTGGAGMNDATAPGSHLEHGVGRDPKTGLGRCVACGWTGPMHMADVHLNAVKRRWRWDAANRRANARRGKAVST